MRTTGRPSPHRMRSVAIRKSALSGSVSSRQGRRYIGCTSASRQGMQITRLGGLSENGLGTSRSSRSSSRRRGYSGSERPVIHVEPAIGALHAARGGIECDVLQGMQGCEHIELVTDECPEASGREDWLPEQEWKKADKSVACDDRKQRDDKEDMANAVVKCRALEHDEANGQQGCSPDDQRLPRLRQEQRQCFQVAGGFSTRPWQIETRCKPRSAIPSRAIPGKSPAVGLRAVPECRTRAGAGWRRLRPNAQT